jgi:imidazolonepropionase-like amidohydrolase
MYRQLAGGVTGAQLLHGSANPIGGQSALIRFRWGSLPEDMKHEGADGFIKFALGENVKQSNWGSNTTTRFPQTRMGVEQVYEDHFTRAYEYGKALEAGKTVRIDLELEALWEIINKKRFISCHSYLQSEITMLMRIADKYNFTLNTFTHILEGYKIADKMKEHGAGASTFSDWWAYKYEVMDAIPYNAKILDQMGIVVAINSDDAEMGRRLNQEAAKSVKYGGMSEESAWKMVTINPAKLLHMDDKVGSIKVGKQADIVLWSDHPLSIYANAEKTWVDGICLFDQKTDLAKRQQIQVERSRLIEKMLAAKIDGQAMQPVIFQPKQHYHCGNTDCNKFVDFNVDLMQQR